MKVMIGNMTKQMSSTIYYIISIYQAVSKILERSSNSKESTMETSI